MKKLFTIMLLNFTVLSNAIAENAYIGASVGDAKVSLDNYSEPIGYKIFVGFKVNDRFGAELGFIDLGNFKRNSVSTRVKGTEISALGFIPVGSEGMIFGKIGLFSWDTRSSVGSFTSQSNGNDVTIGLGIQFPIKDRSLFRIEYQEFRDINDSNDDFSFLSIGLAVTF